MLALSCCDEYGLREIARGLGTCRMVTAHPGEDVQLFSSSFTSFAGKGLSFGDAAILIFAAH